MYQQAQRTLGELSRLEQQLATDNPFSGPVRFASPGSLGLKLYPELLIVQQHPDLTVDYTFSPNEGIESALLNRHLDLSLNTRLGNKPDLTYTPFSEDPLVLVTPSDLRHPQWQDLLRLGYNQHPDGEHHISLLLGATSACLLESGILLKP